MILPPKNADFKTWSHNVRKANWPSTVFQQAQGLMVKLRIFESH